MALPDVKDVVKDVVKETKPASCGNASTFDQQRKHFRSTTQVLSIAIEAGFVFGVISLSYSSHAVQGL